MGKNSKRFRRFQQGTKINQGVCSRCDTEMGILAGPEADEKTDRAFAGWAKDGIDVARLTRKVVYRCPNCGMIHVDAKREDNSGHMMAFPSAGRARSPLLPGGH